MNRAAHMWEEAEYAALIRPTRLETFHFIADDHATCHSPQRLPEARNGGSQAHWLSR